MKSIWSSIGSCLGRALNLIFGRYGGGLAGVFAVAATERGTAGEEERDVGRLDGGGASTAGVARAEAGVMLRGRLTGSPEGASPAGGGVGALAWLFADAPRLSLSRKGPAVVGGGSDAAGVGGCGTAKVSTGGAGCAATTVSVEVEAAGAGCCSTTPLADGSAG